MRKYELAIVLDGGVTPAKKKAVVETIEKLVSVLKGELGKPEELKKETGIYLFFPLELAGPAAGQIDAKLRLEKEIRRYLLIRK